MALAAVNSPIPKCRLCGVRLDAADHRDAGICSMCDSRPEARPFLRGAGRVVPRPRAFTVAEKSLIRRLHAHLPIEELLRILNERLAADTPDAAPFTRAQVQAEIDPLLDASAAHGAWGGLRRVIQDARASGLLASVTPAAVDDFVVLFQLSPAQRTRLQDVLTHVQEGR